MMICPPTSFAVSSPAGPQLIPRLFTQVCLSWVLATLFALIWASLLTLPWWLIVSVMAPYIVGAGVLIGVVSWGGEWLWARWGHPRSARFIGWFLTAVCTGALLVWLMACAEWYGEQAKVLTPREAWFRLTDPISRQFLIEMAWRPRLLWVCLGVPVVSWWLTRPWQVHRWMRPGLLALFLITAICPGITTLPKDPFIRYRVDLIETAVLWWAKYADTPQRGEQAAFRPERMGTFRYENGDPAWRAGPDPFWTDLLGRYAGRPVVVISLESHRLASIAPWNKGAWVNDDLSPHLARLIQKRGIFFSRMMQAGISTATMDWSLSSGLSHHPDIPFLAYSFPPPDHSPIQAFLGAGYKVEWIQATPTTFDGLTRYLGMLKVADQIDEQEIAAFDRTSWTSWGMPDDQLFALAWERLKDSVGPRLTIIASVSNHPPFSCPDTLPDGTVLSGEGHNYTMPYTDWHVAECIRRLLALPAHRRPLIFVTADHTYRQGIANHPLGLEQCPEGYRIPAALFLPDDAGAGTTYGEPFSHYDTLDLLAGLTEVGQTLYAPGMVKFRDRHREYVVTCDPNWGLFARDHVYLSKPRQLYAWNSENLWQWTADNNWGRTAAAADALTHWVTAFERLMIIGRE